MPAPLAIPLIAASPQLGAAILAGGAAIGTYIAGQAFKNSYRNQSSAPNILKPTSTPQQFTDATADYLKAYSEYEVARGQSFNNISSEKDIAREIAKNYNWVAVDEANGKLAILSDGQLAQGGSLNVEVQGSNINFYNDSVSRLVPFENYGTDKLPLAVTKETPINIALSEDGTLPLIIDQEVSLTNRQLVAQTAIEYTNYNVDPSNIAAVTDRDITIDIPTPPGLDVIDQGVQGSFAGISSDIPVAVNQSLAGAQGGIGDDLVTPGFTIEDAVRTAGYLEDTPVISTPESVATAGTIEAARQQEIAAVNAAAAGSANNPGVELPPPLSRANFNNETQNQTNPNFVSQEKTKVNDSGGSQPLPGVRPNPLHAYSNWTYKFTWYAISKDKANLISSGKLKPGGEAALTDGAVLICSSGGSPEHSSAFPKDMYFGAVSLETVVGLSSRNRGTDLAKIEFEIIEPYNATLVPRLVSVNTRLNGNADWGLGFYLLKLDFLGYDDAGNPTKIDKTTKYFPILLSDVQFSVGPKHTTYKFQGAPYHQQSQTALDNTIPFHMEIVGGTVNEVFNGAKSVAVSFETERNAEGSPAGDGGGITGGKPGGPLVKGVAIALNDNEDYIAKGNPGKKKNEYSFEFLDGIGEKEVFDATKYRNQGFAMSDAQGVIKMIDKTKNVFRIQAGTRISDLINIVLQMSKYYTDQYGKTDQGLNLHKIVPQVEFVDYDATTKLWQRKIKFVVTKHTVYGQDVENFGRKAPPGYSKKYQWLFTGKNKDVIDVDINYKVAFFDIKNANERIRVASADGSAQQENSTADKNKKIGEINARTYYASSIADMQNTAAKDRDVKTLSIEELFKRQFDSVGDNVQLKLTIVGDPDLIQQDNILYGVVQSDDEFVGDGSLNYQKREAYFYFEFKAPFNDYSDTDGLFQVSNSSTNSFNGIYKVITVKSDFDKGKFTQQVTNVRVRTQSNESSTARTGDSARAGFRQGGTDNIVEDATYSLRYGDSNPIDVAGGLLSDAVSSTVDTITDAANQAVNFAPDLAKDLIDNNPGDPNVPTSPFG